MAKTNERLTTAINLIVGDVFRIPHSAYYCTVFDTFVDDQLIHVTVSEQGAKMHLEHNKPVYRLIKPQTNENQ